MMLLRSWYLFCRLLLLLSAFLRYNPSPSPCSISTSSSHNDLTVMIRHPCALPWNNVLKLHTSRRCHELLRLHWVVSRTCHDRECSLDVRPVQPVRFQFLNNKPHQCISASCHGCHHFPYAPPRTQMCCHHNAKPPWSHFRGFVHAQNPQCHFPHTHRVLLTLHLKIYPRPHKDHPRSGRILHLSLFSTKEGA